MPNMAIMCPLMRSSLAIHGACRNITTSLIVKQLYTAPDLRSVSGRKKKLTLLSAAGVPEQNRKILIVATVQI
jgi:hypothetical protein